MTTNTQHNRYKVELATYSECPNLGVQYEHFKFKYFETEEIARYYVGVLNAVCKPQKGALFACYSGEETA